MLLCTKGRNNIHDSLFLRDLPALKLNTGEGLTCTSNNHLWKSLAEVNVHQCLSVNADLLLLHSREPRRMLGVVTKEPT